MTQPRRAMPGTAKKSASPAERSEEFAEAQRRLKREAAERRVKAADKASTTKTPPRKTRARG
jgi:hypothetical protein